MASGQGVCAGAGCRLGLRIAADTGRVLLDAEMDVPLVAEVHKGCPVKADVVDLHVWRVGRGKYACILGVATTADVHPAYFRQQLSIHEELVRVTVKVNKPTRQGQLSASSLSALCWHARLTYPRFAFRRRQRSISPTMPWRKTRTQATKMAPWMIVDQAPIWAK